VAPPPPTLAVAGLVDDDSIDPRPQRGLASEPTNHAEHLEEHFLREIAGFFIVAEQVQRKLEDHALVVGHQRRTRIIVSSGAPAHQDRIPIRNVRPTQGRRLFH
jgi:hypothetical protein